MIAELEQPFVWPEESEAQQQHKKHEKEYNSRMTPMEKLYTKKGQKWWVKGGKSLMRTDRQEFPDRKALREQAEKLLNGQEAWDNKSELDERWKNQQS